MTTESNKQSKIALITGATRGIGRACALQLAQDGFDIAFCYRSSGESAETLKSEIEALGRRSFSAQVDVADFNAVQDMMDTIDEALGDIDVVVNNAGITKDNPLVLLSEEDWHQVIRTNLDSVFNVSKGAAFRFMKRKSGSIINMSSVAGAYGNPAQTNYAASKAGIIGFTKTLAKEVGPYNVRVNAVAPGFIHTDMTSDLPQKVIDRVMPNIPMRRIGDVQEVANLVSFLASDLASYITAQTIHVDGGVMI